MKHFCKQALELLVPGDRGQLFCSAMQFPMLIFFNSQNVSAHDYDGEEEEENPSYVTKAGVDRPKYFHF